MLFLSKKKKTINALSTLFSCHFFELAFSAFSLHEIITMVNNIFIKLKISLILLSGVEANQVSFRNEGLSYDTLRHYHRMIKTS